MTNDFIMTTIIPIPATPSFLLSGTLRGDDYTWRITIPEVFVINGKAMFFPTQLPDRVQYAGSGEWTKISGVEYEWNCVVSTENDGTAVTDSTNSRISLTYSVTAILTDGMVDLLLTIRNTSKADWDENSFAIACFQQGQNPTLLDKNGEHTFVLRGSGRFQSLASVKAVVEELQQHLDEEHRGQFAFYHSTNTEWNQHTTGNVIIRASHDSVVNTGMAFNKCFMLSGNLGQGNCIHANPQFGPLRKGESKRMPGAVCFDGGSIDDVRYRLGKNIDARTDK